MYTSGFTIIYKDEEQDWLFEDRVRFTWWLQLRMKAAYQPCVQSVGRTRVTINLNVGEFATTKVFLARMWDADERAVDTFLNLLEQDGRISMRRESNILIIKIHQYERFSPPAGYFNRKKSSLESDELSKESRTEMQSQMQTLMRSDTLDGTLDNTVSETQTEAQTETRINKINNITIKTENFNYSETARSQEIEFFKKLKNCSEEDRYFLCKNITCSEPELLNLIDQFEGHVFASEEYHNSFARLKGHFSNWAKIQFRNDEIKKSKMAAPIEKKSESKAAARKGSDGAPRPASDYDAPFPTRPN